ncbi:hypothetical protein H6P81_012350 [Aristolochia fimbriata]|uniref:Fructose-2,6-bisphosphatase n=1 Tax=Aristolochia fimbriata TaxID=158543 RepID=A0AAV7EET9_ARIFI|nr:hypothetical protein H6P81_012350 [Aristolochia fimbriata]
MGAAQSSQERDADEEEDEEEEEEQREAAGRDAGLLLKKVLQQEPEILPSHASASPLSPQPSTVGTPRLGPSIKVWDPYNVLSAAPPPLPLFPPGGVNPMVEVYLIAHGECGVSLRPDLVGGRCPTAALTADGNRQARALAVFLKSQGVNFNAVYSSPLERARATALSICQELNFFKEQIQSSDALTEMSLGQWEGCLQSEIYTPEMISLIDRCQPDFSAPAGESLRQVEFRMVEFLNSTVSRLLEKYPYLDKGFSRSNSDILTNHIQASAGSSLSHWDLLPRPPRPGLSRKVSGKSRLQFVSTVDNEGEDELFTRDSNQAYNETTSRSSTYTVGVFTHVIPIKCLLTGLLGCSPAMIHRLCIDDSSMTVLRRSLRSGWQIKRLNDTSHLRLL